MSWKWGQAWDSLTHPCGGTGDPLRYQGNLTVEVEGQGTKLLKAGGIGFLNRDKGTA